MRQTHQIIRTKLTPPRPPRYTLPRKRLTERLLEAHHYRLTLVLAGTGYGKSTALAAMVQESVPLAWYHLDAEDTDPQLFLLHLYYGLVTAVPYLSTTPLALLEQWPQNPEVWTAVTDALTNELTIHGPDSLFLILDDAHLLNQSDVTLRVLDRFISHAPPSLHIILATRYPLQLPTLVTWRVHGHLQEIGQADLAFTTAEIEALFRHQYDWPLTPEQTEFLMARSEGWPIALQLVWQRLSRAHISLGEALGQLSGGDLFAYLAQEVLAQQPPDVGAFLGETAVLRQLSPDNCDALRDATDSRQILRYLHENGLFVVDLGHGHMRYHHLFRDLILHQLPQDKMQAHHQRAAAVYQTHNQTEEAIYHLLQANAFTEAAQLLTQLGRTMIRSGRLDTLAGWIGTLPPAVLEFYPPLLVYLGDIARLHSRFDEALGWYQQAEERSRARGELPGVGQALRGQARVYLDTVNPSQAEQLLQEALRLSDGQDDRESRARLLELLAENLLNQGRMAEAGQYRRQASELRQEGPGKAELSVRVLLRTGRLAQARRLLEAQVERERQEPVLRPRAHRETLLLLSLILTMQGEAEAAYQCAVDGTKRGQAMDSPFVTAVGYMRQGHAWLLRKDEQGYSQAYRCFHEAIRISKTLDVPRLKVEANWGLCQAHGFRGHLDAAQNAATQGLKIAHAAGDEWVMACIRTSLGASYALARQFDQASHWLTQANNAFRECGDSYGQAVSRLWQCLIWHKTGDATRLDRDMGDLLHLVQAHDYPYLFLRKNMMGPPDPRASVPLLLYARDQNQHGALAENLLRQMGLARLQIYPGYQLRLHLLGSFHAWRGTVEIGPSEWKRRKARQLFLLLVTHRPTLLDREQIGEILWPELDPAHAQRDFKIAYSSLLQVLEPERERNAPSAFMARDGSRYGLRPEADIWLDVAEFDALVAQGNAVYSSDRERAMTDYRQAMALYQGEYLQEYPYEEWCSEVRERRLTAFLQTAERVAAHLVEQGAWDEAVRVAQRILAQDDCWEQAYRVLMQAYAQLGERTQAIRTYQRCLDRLQSELGVSPSPATVQLYESLR